MKTIILYRDFPKSIRFSPIQASVLMNGNLAKVE